MLLHGKSVMSLLLSIVGRGPPSGLGTGCCFVPSLAAERRDERETGTTLYTRPNVQYLHTRYRHWSEKNFIFLGTGCVFLRIFGFSKLFTLPTPSLWAWYWLRHALSGSRRPDTGTDVFSDNTTTEREQQKWENLREDNRMHCVLFRPCIKFPRVTRSAGHGLDIT